MEKLPYPIDAFPIIMRNAAYEEHNITKAPMAMIGSAMLSAVSLACQSKVDVERPGGLKGPTSLFFVTIAEVQLTKMYFLRYMNAKKCSHSNTPKK